MLHPPPPEVKISAPQTRKRKRENAAAEVEVGVEGDAEAEVAPEGTKSKSKESSRQPSDPPTQSVPETMTVDGPESEGEVEVENLLHATQSCSIGEPEGDRDAPDEKVGPSSSDCPDFENMELQYPTSEEPMDVDGSPAPGADVEVEKKPPDSERSEPIAVDGDVAEGTEVKPAEPTTEGKEPSKEGSADGHDDAEPAVPSPGASEHPT